MLMRKSNWQSALAVYLSFCATQRFRYGRLDCGLFVAGAIEVMTGVDVIPGIPAYAGRREAFAAVRALCGAASMEALAADLAARAGLKETPPLLAQRGDPVLLGRGKVSSLGIVAMHGTEILSPGRLGTLRFPLHLATRAWRV